MMVNKDNGNHLVMESSYNYPRLQAITGPHHVAKIIRDTFGAGNLPEEHVYMIAMSTAFTVKGVFEISHGGFMSVPIQPREIFVRAYLVGAAGIILTHNHPSGEVKPSPDDIMKTKKLCTVGEIMGIVVYDHIIITAEKYYSMLQDGVMPSNDNDNVEDEELTK